MTPPFASVAELLAVLADERPGDVVTAQAHACQCAARLQALHPDDEELQIAGLVHDVASSVDPPPAGCHAAQGARLVRSLLGDRVATLVAGHVAAKRWLVTDDPAYRGLLSEESRETLTRQGEAQGVAAREAFARSPHFATWIALRRADDAAKIPGARCPPLESWRPLLEKLAARARR